MAVMPQHSEKGRSSGIIFFAYNSLLPAPNCKSIFFCTLYFKNKTVREIKQSVYLSAKVSQMLQNSLIYFCSFVQIIAISYFPSVHKDNNMCLHHKAAPSHLYVQNILTGCTVIFL